MKKTWIAGIAGSALVITLAAAGTGLAKSGEEKIVNGTIRVERQSEAEYPGMAKITLDQAKAAAVAAVPGTVLKAELDDEDGFLVYGIEIVSADKSTITEVMVDAGDGKVLATELDQADKEDRDS